MLTLGFTGFFLTEEALRKALGDSVPRDVIEFLLDQSQRMRGEFLDRISQEFGRVLERVDPVEVARRLLDGRTVEVSARFRLVPEERQRKEDAGGGASERSERAEPAASRAARGSAGARVGTLLWAVAIHHGVGPIFRKGSWLEPNSFLVGDVPGELLPAFARARAALRRPRDRRLLRDALRGGAHARGLRHHRERLLRLLRDRGRPRLALLPLALVGGDPAVLRRRGPGRATRRCSRRPGAASAGRCAWRPICRSSPSWSSTSATSRARTPSCAFALSPWPVVQILGLELVASAIAALELGVALGLAGLSRGPLLAARRRARDGGLPARLARGRLRERAAAVRRPARSSTRATAIACLCVLAACALWTPRGREAWARRAANVALGGFLAALPLVAGQALTRIDYSVTRDGRAQQIIDALAAQREKTGAYPDELSELVGAGLLAEVPRPRIGFGSSQEFIYQNFGESYLLEFSAPRWIQCAYNPPWQLDPGEELGPEDGEDAGGAWSCP